ncbi:copper chaperone PCu(A)C [Shewanella salipaludis]|uniref:Copper chaperone PCu(A)C n=1 Tax=Shewanella salipaludis TaxID=2723052 RepID=A0A972FSC4_9GAMM|nr:copper chaperone PCu(A)C [Shewanella salipaludis]NMH65290.1 copper chaperone PCu(A)C [Shewanella salipaludis]
MEFKTLRPIFKQMFKFAALSCLSFPVLADITLVEGHIRAMPASVPNSAAYLTLANDTDRAVRLVGIRTDIAREAQLHTLIEEQGMVKMRSVDGFEIPAHGTLVLSPSGSHIMLLGLKALLAVAQEVRLELILEPGEPVSVTLPVLKQADAAMQHEHHHH